jgi:diguanylate cyclase (GGDEF)-like protein
MHFEDLALAAVQAGALPLAKALMERAQALLPDERLAFALAKAALFKVQGKPVQALAQLDAVLPQCDAEGDAKPGLRMRCNLALARAELLEVCGEPIAALQALRDWRSLQAERARRASQARYQAAQLQTELLQLQHRVEEEDSKRQAAERARALLAEAHAALQRKMEEVQALQAQLHIQATQDALTGLANRRHLNETLPSVLALALRDGTPLAVALIDLDRFKQVNDTHGHPAGDQVLAAFGLLLRQHLRKSDLAFRYGGEEFCLLMPNTPAMDAQQKLKALLTDWRAMAFALDSGAVLRLQTFSAGVTDSMSSLASPAGLLQAADARLLQAKQPRGCVVL